MDPYLANMKKTSPSSRSKPPPVRSAYLCGKLRNNLCLDRPGFHLPSGIDNSSRLLSMSENPEVPETVENINALKASSKEVTECMSGWLTFIQMLKQLCAAGADLSRSLGALGGPGSACGARAAHCRAAWDHLGGAATAAAAVVTRQVVAGLQEAHTGPDIDADQIDANQQVVCSGLMTLVNLQYQFSVACCECLGGLADCRCQPPHTEADTHAVARCFARLPPPPPPQRRWSEAAGAAEARVESARRWSMPWKLSLPTGHPSGERSRSTTPDAIWHTALASQEELQDVIALLSINPAPQGHHLPGVTLTRAAEPMASRCSSHRGSWWGEGEEPDMGMLVSRKSSSSTDCSSSCYSLHSRASTSGSDELTHGQRSHLYSMWSGSDLPFIKLPESTENPDT